MIILRPCYTRGIIIPFFSHGWEKITVLVAHFQLSTTQPKHRGIWKLGRDYCYPVEGMGYVEAGFQCCLEVFNPVQAAGEQWWLSLVGCAKGGLQHRLNSEEGGWGVLGERRERHWGSQLRKE